MVDGPQLFHVCHWWLKPLSSTDAANGGGNGVGDGVGEGEAVGVTVGGRVVGDGLGTAFWRGCSAIVTG